MNPPGNFQKCAKMVGEVSAVGATSAKMLSDWKVVPWWIGYALSRALFTTVCDIRFLPSGSLPDGGVLLACNHISHFDPPILGSQFDRKVDFMAMNELLARPVSRTLFTMLDVIPVNRAGRDPVAMREAIRRLQDGGVVAIFPEGGIRSGKSSVLGGAPMPGGAAAIARKSGCPILPCLIMGSDQLYAAAHWLSRPRVFIATADLIEPAADDNHTCRHLTDAWLLMAQRIRSQQDYDETLEPMTAQERWALPC